MLVIIRDLAKVLNHFIDERLGVNGVEEIKLHPFFAGVDWKRIRDKKAPYVPEVFINLMGKILIHLFS